MWTWLSIRPGIAIAPPASITTSQAASCAALAVPTEVILPSAIRMASPAAVGLRQSPVTMVPRLTIAVFMGVSSGRRWETNHSTLVSIVEKLCLLGIIPAAGRRPPMKIRRVLSFIDETHEEAGQPTAPPLRKVAVVAIVRNPFAGTYQADLKPLVDASADVGREISRMAVQLLKPFAAESYGKAAVVGVAGEQEHGVAMLTTVFGDVLRDAVGGGVAWISSVTKRAAAGATIDI